MPAPLPRQPAPALDLPLVGGGRFDLAAATPDTDLRVAYGMEEATMRAWGLYLSKGLTDSEPAVFGEPGLFLVRPDGSLYSAHVQSTPFARPRLAELLKVLEFVREKDYLARGEAGAPPTHP